MIQWMYKCVALVALVLVGCSAESSSGSSVRIDVIDQLEGEFLDYLKKRGVKYEVENERLTVFGNQPPTILAFNIVTGFYRTKGIDPTDKTIYFADSVIYCCNFDGYLISYLESYYGHDFVQSLETAFRETAEMYPLSVGCNNCSLYVQSDADKLYFSIETQDKYYSEQEVRAMLGFSSPPRRNSITSMVIDKYDVDSLVLEFILENSVIRTEAF